MMRFWRVVVGVWVVGLIAVAGAQRRGDGEGVAAYSLAAGGHGVEVMGVYHAEGRGWREALLVMDVQLATATREHCFDVIEFVIVPYPADELAAARGFGSLAAAMGTGGDGRVCVARGEVVSTAISFAMPADTVMVLFVFAPARVDREASVVWRVELREEGVSGQSGLYQVEYGQ
jgi:hypothetical protein